MGNFTLMFGLVVVVLLIGLVATLWVGHSRENREGNPEYDRSSVPNWRRLSILYIIFTAVLVGLFFWFIRG